MVFIFQFFFLSHHLPLQSVQRQQEVSINALGFWACSNTSKIKGLCFTHGYMAALSHKYVEIPQDTPQMFPTGHPQPALAVFQPYGKSGTLALSLFLIYNVVVLLTEIEEL